jgi:CRP-like cAMP-binding protein
MLKKLFGNRPHEPAREPELSIDDLVVLERYDEAIDRLESRLRSYPKDLHAHLRLGEVLIKSGKGGRALDQYLFVADSYTDDGFYDKAIALLTKIQRLSGDEAVTAKILRVQRLKSLEHSRVLAIEGLIRGEKETSPLDRVSPVDAQQVWRGLATSPLVERLPGDQLKRLFSAVAITEWRAGEVVAERGSGIERMFVIANGVVEAVVPHPEEGGREIQIRTLASGDVFGERALFEHRPWPATYRAVERARLLRLDRSSLEQAMAGSSDPRGLLEALRAQHIDRDVAAAAEKLLGSPV